MAIIVTRKITHDVKDFTCGVNSIDTWVQESYYGLLTKQMNTYEIVLDGRTVGYYGLMFREVKPEECKEEVAEYSAVTLSDKFISVCIKYLVVDVRFHRRGIGTKILWDVIKRVKLLSKEYPIRLIVIDALPELVEWYKTFGFAPMEHNSIGQDGFSEQMFIELVDYKQLDEYAASTV